MRAHLALDRLCSTHFSSVPFNILWTSVPIVQLLCAFFQVTHTCDCLQSPALGVIRLLCLHTQRAERAWKFVSPPPPHQGLALAYRSPPPLPGGETDCKVQSILPSSLQDQAKTGAWPEISHLLCFFPFPFLLPPLLLAFSGSIP